MIPRRSFLFLPAVGLFAKPAGQFETPPPLPIVNRLVFGGDVMMSRYVGSLAAAKQDPAWPLRDVASLFSGADLAFVNLEAPFSDHGPPSKNGMIFKAAPNMIAGLELAGIDVVSTANNHARDCGSYGVEFTLDWLAKHGIRAVGTGANGDAVHEGVVVERHGVRFGFLAYTFDQSNGNYKDKDERVAMLDAVRAARDIASMCRRADVVIVSMHAGTEYRPQPNEQQKQFAHAAIDAGAKMVIGHHPHVVQPVEEYGTGVIFYSLGNLVFDQFQRKETQVGRVVEAFFIGKMLIKYEVIPVDIVKTVPRVRDSSAAAFLAL
jgi:poly-gamma-glutamate capsule biosynthesis protein CapA/YwtB (metallophosphatase superfamily)